MDQDNNADDRSPEGDGENEAPRARNRTVLLTPEITGQVRARLAQDGGQQKPHDNPVSAMPRRGASVAGEAPSRPRPVPPAQSQPASVADAIAWSKKNTDCRVLGFIRYG